MKVESQAAREREGGKLRVLIQHPSVISGKGPRGGAMPPQTARVPTPTKQLSAATDSGHSQNSPLPLALQRKANQDPR